MTKTGLNYFCLLSVLVFCLASTATAADPPILLKPGPHLFIDDYLIAKQSNIKRIINTPSRLPHPIITGKEDKNFQSYVTILRDPDTDLFRIWYSLHLNGSHMGYMESTDGINWIRPYRVLKAPGKIEYGISVIDEGPDYQDPDKRYKWGWYHGSGLKIAASPDGLNWKMLADGVVLKHDHDINCIFRDPIRDRYIALVSSYTTGETWTGKRRIPMQSVSNDLIKWQEPWFIFTPDKIDQGQTQFYCMAGLIARGDLLIGMLKVLRDDLPADPNEPVAGIGYTVLAWSRDGKTWQRDRQPFLDRNQKPGTWDHAMTWADCQLNIADQTYIYYGGYKRGHKINRYEERQIGLAVMPRDRYVARQAANLKATLTTPLITLDASDMFVNAEVKGRMRIRILDKNGLPLPGFDYNDCKPITGDSVRHLVRFKASLASLADKAVFLEFAFSNGKLYGFELIK